MTTQPRTHAITHATIAALVCALFLALCGAAVTAAPTASAASVVARVGSHGSTVIVVQRVIGVAARIGTTTDTFWAFATDTEIDTAAQRAPTR